MKNLKLLKLLIIFTFVPAAWLILVAGNSQRFAAAAGKDRDDHHGLPFSEELAALGDRIFDDRNLSIGRNQACNTCHNSAWGFTGPDANVNAHGAVFQGSLAGRFGNRKPSSAAYSTVSPTFALTRDAEGLFAGGNFWDGRATGERLGNPASEQAQGPFLNPLEQGLRDEACVVYRVKVSDYAGVYRELWGANIDAIVFPAAIDELCEAEGPRFEIDAVNRAMIGREYDNIAVSIAVYEESQNLFSSKFDAMRRGLYRFTREEQKGFALFQSRAKCSRCHTSTGIDAVFTDQTFDNLGVPANPENPFYQTQANFVDQGLGGFLATRPEWSVFAEAQRGKMRVPTLRNIDLRPFPGAAKAYMHNGVFKSLEEVVRFYNTRDTLPVCSPSNTRADWGVLCWAAPENPVNVNREELGDLGLNADEEAALVAFLKTLSDGYLPAPARTAR